MDKCAVGAFEKLIKKQTAGGGKARILPLRGKSGSYGKKNAAQALPIPRAGPSVSLPGDSLITAALRRRLTPTRRSACRDHLFRVIFRALRLLFVTASGVGAAGARAARISASESMSFSSNRFVKVSTTVSVL